MERSQVSFTAFEMLPSHTLEYSVSLAALPQMRHMNFISTEARGSTTDA